MRVAVVGGGWAGLAAAVRASQCGHEVTLLEMAGQLGGRARSIEVDGRRLDNGQHILIGAYTRTLALMATVQADILGGLERRALELRYPDGHGLRVPVGASAFGFVRAVLGAKGWSARDRVALLAAAMRWALAGFRCAPELTVAELCHALPRTVRESLIEPLCVAALNTPASQASAAVWLRVLHDALFGAPGSADFLLPRRPLSALLPEPAARWLHRRGVDLRLGVRAQSLEREAHGWRLNGESFGTVVLACTAAEAARLAAEHAPAWSRQALALHYEPIVTVYLHCAGARLPVPMMSLREGPAAPAQFGFDHGALGASAGVFAFVVSGARAWVDAGLAATAAAVQRQAYEAFAAPTWPTPPTLLHVAAEKRATFRCVPGLVRPPTEIAPGLLAAGDYVLGPYPATLEGAVRSGEAAAARLGG